MSSSALEAPAGGRGSALLRRIRGGTVSRLRRWLGPLPVVGPACRYVKRLLYRPMDSARLRELEFEAYTTFVNVRSIQTQSFQTLKQETERLHEQYGRCHDQLAALVQEHRQWGQRFEGLLAEERRSQAWLHSLAEAQTGVSEWVGRVQNKLDQVALDLRERVRVEPEGGALPEPRIVDAERHAERLAEQGDGLRVNLGCGTRPLARYVNVDVRPLPGVDVVADVRRLPFAPGSVAEVASHHLVQLFREHHLATVVLPYWKSLLRPGGVLRVVCPNWQAVLDQLREGAISVSEFKRLTFGGQEHAGNDHLAMYTPETLTEVLRRAGFAGVNVLATDRPNGPWVEMELEAAA
jgi:predicted SAM-dependent methyltransferase